MPSVAQTYPFPLTHPIRCEWLTGCNFAFHRAIFAEFSYDEKLRKYSFGEDLDLSYRVFQRYRQALFLVPQARGQHKVSVTSRSAGQEYYSMREVYRLYLFYKLFQPTIKNQWVYGWSQLGRFLEAVLLAFRERTFSNLSLLLHAYGYSLRNMAKIKRGELEFFNHQLKD
jgi:glucosyl-dolichyl phosphate glucuronosyltransferase